MPKSLQPVIWVKSLNGSSRRNVEYAKNENYV